MSDRPPESDDPLAEILSAGASDESDDELRPRTRRQAREWAASRQAAAEPPPRRGFARWGVVLAILVVALLIIGGGVAAWNSFQPGLSSLFAAPEPTDYDGPGEGSVTVIIKDGDDGSDVAHTLADNDVVKTFDAFYSLLLQKRPEPVFNAGSYQLHEHMSASQALDALMDPENRISHSLTVPEGMREADILKEAAKVTGLSRRSLEKAARSVDDFDVPGQAESLEGFLFPATYDFGTDVTPHDVISRMVARSNKELDDLEVPEDDRFRVVTLASIVQAEAGPNEDDLGKIARVFVNRIDKDMLLQSDATVKYKAGGIGSVWTTDKERGDKENPYNTYYHHGLTPGPISNPGRDALKAAASPAEGDWLYFVTVNLRTGETLFTKSYDEHKKAVKKLQTWCDDPDNAEYCD